MAFVFRRLDDAPKTLGEKLRELRRSKAVSLEMMERFTRIQRKYLEALEWGKYDALPEPMYTRHFLRAYASALEADAGYFLEMYEGEIKRSDLLAPHRLPRERARPHLLRAMSRVSRVTGLALVFLIVAGYFSLEIYKAFAPPTISLVTPATDTLITEPTYIVEGKVTEGDVTVRVNGEPVVVSEDGTFVKRVDIREGVNHLRVDARRRYSWPREIERQIVYEPATETVGVFRQGQGISFVAE